MEFYEILNQFTKNLMNYLDFIKIGQKQQTFYINIYMPVYTSFISIVIR
jgi:hypothetical protein